MEINIRSPKITPLSTRYCTVNSSLDNSFICKNQQYKQRKLNNQAIQLKSIKNFFLQEKLEVLLKAEDNLMDKIKKNIQLKKQNSKMSILSMQKQKFIVSRGPSTYRRALNSIRKQQNININEKDSLNTRKNSSNLTHFQFEMHRQGNYYNSEKVQNFKKYLKILALNHQKVKKGRKSQILIRLLIDFLYQSKQQTVIKDLFQIQSISGQLILCLTKKDHIINLNVIRKISGDIAKLVFNICYQVYRRKKKGVTHEQLIKINKQIDYCSRRLRMFDLTLRTCFDLGKLNCDKMNYQEGFSQYQKAVKLAIYINNKYYQEVGVDKMGICRYYMADSSGALFFHNNSSHLSTYDRKKIKEQYSNQQQIADLLEKKKKKNQKQNKDTSAQQNIQTLNNFGHFTFENHQAKKQNYPLLNNLEFKKNFKNIIKIKNLKQKIHLIKKCMKKTDSIGQRKYCGQHYIVPKASRFTKNQYGGDINQVCLSHRSFNRSNVEEQTIKLENQCKLLVKTLNYFINDGIIQISEKQIVEQF